MQHLPACFSSALKQSKVWLYVYDAMGFEFS